MILKKLFNKIPEKLCVTMPIILGTIAIDQITKAMILYALSKGQIIKIASYFNLVLVFNYGVSFGMFQSHGMLGFWLLILIAVGLCGWLAVMIHQSNQRFEHIAFALVIGGAIGNISDRFLYGGVVDFLDFHWKKHHWPAFNIADSAIVVGAILIFLYQVCQSLKDRSSIKHSKKMSTKKKIKN